MAAKPGMVQWKLARMMAEWATIEHETGVEPPPLPPPLELVEAVREATQEASGVSVLGTTAAVLDSSAVVPPLQLRARVRPSPVTGPRLPVAATAPRRPAPPPLRPLVRCHARPQRGPCAPVAM
jgi:hypothetical protein